MKQDLRFTIYDLRITTVTAVLFLLLCFPCRADLRQAKDLMKQNQPAKAKEVLQNMITKQPGDPWLVYDSAVAAYAAKDFQQADKIWEDLAGTELSEKLRDKVWTQIGNVSYRLGEQVEEKTPEEALPKWEQSREAYRVVLATRPKDKMAQHNLKVVELKLAKLHLRLAQRLHKEAQNKNLQETIEKLEAALDHERTAQELDPQSQEAKEAVQQTEKQLAEKLAQRATQEEKKADNVINNPQPSDWERNRAVEDLKTALADFQEAKTLDEKNREAQEGEKRVEEKLANLMAQQGRKFQQEAKNETNYNPEKAVDDYEKALEKFEEALAMKPEHQDALAGEKEVKEALEQLHIERGDKLADEGRKEVKQRPDDAAEKMMNALEHYQEAQAINPDNPTLPPKIEALEKELPPLLVALGQKEQRQAAQDEPKSTENAIAHLEKAATSFEMAQELDKDNQPAQKGEQEVQQDLARLRDKLAQQAEAKNQQQQNQQQNQQQSQQQNQQQSQESFQSLLSQVKDPQKQKQYDESRRGNPKKYDPNDHRIFKNW